MKINNPLQTASRSKLEKEIEDYKSGVFRSPTLSIRIAEHNIKYKEDIKLSMWGDWDITNVTDFSRMFEGCTLFNNPLAAWNLNTQAVNENK